MKNNTIFLVALVLLIVFMGGKYVYQSPGQQNLQSGSVNSLITEKNCLADDCLTVSDLVYPVSELSEDAKKALEQAIEDEYKALSVYESVIKKLGSVRPFSMIKGAEEQHIASLKNLFDKYGLKVPTNTWTNKISAPASLQQACQMGVEAEIANANMYSDKLLPSVSSYEDITLVFNNLMSASRQKHLPAFERCN